MAVIVGMLANGITDTKLLVSVFTFNLLWIFIDVYQMSTVASVDTTGKFAALMPGAQDQLVKSEMLKKKALNLFGYQALKNL